MEKIRRKLKGKVVSDRGEKTIVVLVDRFVKHRRYGKFIRISKRYKVHDEKDMYKKGDKVVIEACKPVSKDKHFKVTEKVS